MASLNSAKKAKPKYTHEGAPAALHLNAEQQLRRSVSSCFLWEREFYEDGVEIAQRIMTEAEKVSPKTLAELAVEVRSKMNLRHVPLLLLSVLTRTGAGGKADVAGAIEKTIQRADELAEFLVVHAALNKVTPDKMKKKISSAMKRGLAAAFRKFSEYDLAKYNRDKAVTLRDALFLCHAKPANAEQESLWKRLVNDELKTPDTWEVALSGGADKKETFERLMKEGSLGYLALLRNLRNMATAGCDVGLVRDAILARKGAQRVLPFRYTAAARAAPQFEPYLDQALSEAISEMPPLPGKTIVLVDVSGSMDAKLSGKSDLSRMDAAATLASIIHGDLRVFTFSNSVVEVPPRRGMAGVDAIIKSQAHSGTRLGHAVQAVSSLPHDRLIVITDEQSSDPVTLKPAAQYAYMINVASNRNGVGYGKWTHIDGFSESVLRFIQEHERLEQELER